MLRLRQDEHFEFKITSNPGDYLNPTMSVNLLPAVVKWLDDHNAEWNLNRVATSDYRDYYLVLEVGLEITDPDLEMLFKLTWL